MRNARWLVFDAIFHHAMLSRMIMGPLRVCKHMRSGVWTGSVLPRMIMMGCSISDGWSPYFT